MIFGIFSKGSLSKQFRSLSIVAHQLSLEFRFRTLDIVYIFLYFILIRILAEYLVCTVKTGMIKLLSNARISFKHAFKLPRVHFCENFNLLFERLRVTELRIKALRMKLLAFERQPPRRTSWG